MLAAMETYEDAVWRWREAQALARMAYDECKRRGGATAYARYRAAQDEADRAQDALAWRTHSFERST